MARFRFPEAVKIPQLFANSRVIKDNFKRQQFAKHEVTTQALKYIARNTTLPPRARLEAQLQLASMPGYTRETQIRARCAWTGHSRGVLKQFSMNRVQFRLRALNGEIPGVKKGAW